MSEPALGAGHLIFHSESFPTEGGWIGEDPDPERPAGRELIEVLLAAVDPDRPAAEIWNEEGFGWAFNYKFDGITVNVLVQYVDHWLVIVKEVSLVPRFLRGPKHGKAVLEVCARIHRALSRLNHVGGMTWTTAEGYAALESKRAGRTAWTG